jgi:hypothetical protein
MEQAANVGDTRKMYRLIYQHSKSNVTISETIRDSSGTILADRSSQTKRWKEHFEALLNHDDPPTPNVLLQPPVTIKSPVYEIDCSPPTVTEILGIIKRLQNNKAPGEDGITSEILKACSSTIPNWLCDIFNTAWTNEEIPQDWREAILLPFFKKGDNTQCSNYRGISLMAVVGKIFAILLLNRFQSYRDRRTRCNQAGFRQGRGCIDHIFSLRRILEHRGRYQQPTITCFVDFAAAFDSLHRSSLWSILEADGLPPKLVNLIKAYYAGTGSRVLIRGEQSERFETRTGVRQGCPLSPILFNFAIDWVLKTALSDSIGVQISPQHNITDLDYADDIVIFAESYTAMQLTLSKIDTVSRSIGLRINAAKTKIFSAGFSRGDILPVSLSGVAIEEVEQFRYLGSTFLPNGQCKHEIDARIDAARKAFFVLKKPLWSRREISLQTKIKVFQAAIRSILLYGCETWPLKIEDERRLMIFDHWCLRIILRVRYFHRVSNTSIRSRSGNITALNVVIQERRLRWFGHVLRTSPDELTYLSLNARPLNTWKRKRGGQLMIWSDRLKTDLENSTGRTVYGIRRWNRDWLSISEDLAQNRPAWRALTRDIIGAS